jgi:hypothetical protein
VRCQPEVQAVRAAASDVSPYLLKNRHYMRETVSVCELLFVGRFLNGRIVFFFSHNDTKQLYASPPIVEPVKVDSSSRATTSENIFTDFLLCAQFR